MSSANKFLPFDHSFRKGTSKYSSQSPIVALLKDLKFHHIPAHNITNMSGRLVKVAGVGAAAGVGYYLYQAGGQPKVAEKKFERESWSYIEPCLSQC